MFMFGKKITALFLIIVLMSSLFSCAADTQKKQTETSNTASAIDSETEIDYYKNIPAGTDYGGYKFTVLEYDNTDWYTYIGINEQNGEVLNDAAYTRNVEVSELLGIEINMIRKPMGEALNAMKKSKEWTKRYI